MTVFLSHFMSKATPGFGGSCVFESKVASSISLGRSSNSSIWTFNNHCGTHIDVPYHFSDTGKTLSEYSAGDWIFNSPYLIDYEAKENELIEPSDWLESVPADTDLLLIRTKFEMYRTHTRYWQNNPGLSGNMARWLRTNRPLIRAVGFDFISLTAFQNREAGRQAHREFLCEERGAPILIIEDMALRQCPTELKRVVVAPLLVEGADGGPVTVFAET